MLPPEVIGMMAIVIVDPSLGVANYLLGQVDIAPRLFLAHPEWAVGTFVPIDAWQQTPFVALIGLGGLQALPAPLISSSAPLISSWSMARMIRSRR